MWLEEQLEPEREFLDMINHPSGIMTHHSHLNPPGMGPEFFASIPHARICPVASYSRHVGIFLNVSNEPGQFSICCTLPPAIREEP